MKVVVEHFGKKYTYVEIAGNMNWINERQIVVPVLLHTVLREKAIALGVDKSVFIGEVKMPLASKKVKPESKKISALTKKSKNLKGQFNPLLKEI